MNIRTDVVSELQVKSTERVRDLGEVFTPAATVNDMLDLLPPAMWEVHPSPTFLEPACGTGNFLVQILARKLDTLTDRHNEGTLPAGTGKDAVVFHALEALASIYAVDISADNVIGGTPGHEFGARDRVLAVFVDWYRSLDLGRLSERSLLLRSARWIVEHNVLVANMLATNADGTPSGRDALPLVEYSWDPEAGTVTVLTTTLGAVTDAAAAESGAAPTLFGPPEPTEVWSGRAERLCDVPVPTPVPMVAYERNGRRRG